LPTIALIARDANLDGCAVRRALNIEIYAWNAVLGETNLTISRIHPFLQRFPRVLDGGAASDD
jgi:hypothetical protein